MGTNAKFCRSDVNISFDTWLNLCDTLTICRASNDVKAVYVIRHGKKSEHKYREYILREIKKYMDQKTSTLHV